jgi:hypothetical protein
MDGVLSSALHDATYGWLDRLDVLVHDADLESRAALAQGEIPRLSSALRALLGEHESDEDGRCKQCTGWRRRRAYRCSVWLTVYRRLVANDAAETDAGRHVMTPHGTHSW